MRIRNTVFAATVGFLLATPAAAQQEDAILDFIDGRYEETANPLLPSGEPGSPAPSAVPAW